MSIETEVAALTTATTNLLEAVNVSKATLDAKVGTASTSAAEALSYKNATEIISKATDSARAGAESARDTAVAVVTGGTANAVPAAGKIPIGDNYGRIPFGWANQGRFSRLLQNIKSRTVRVYHGGTSIEAASNSATRHWLAAIAAQMGDSGNETQILSVLGGSYETAFNGWKKQPFGGIQFYRLRGETTSTELSFVKYCKRIVIRYSTEVGASSCDVLVDGVAAGTINCNAPQSYNNEFVLNYSSLEMRTISIKPPSSGFVYLEAIDWCIDKPGLHVIDAAYGGSSIGNMVTLRTPVGAQVAGIPIEANVAINAMFAKNSADYALDLAIVGWCVNDAGSGLTHVNNVYAPALANIVAQTRANGVPLVLVIEMGGHYSMPANPKYAAYARIRELMRSYASEPHVTIFDWHAASRPDVIATWAATYYPTAVFNEITGIVTSGDFIHPISAGHAILTDMLCTASGLPSTGQQNTPALSVSQLNNRAAAVSGSLPLYALAQPPGIVREQKNTLGLLHRYRCIGTAHAMQQPYANKLALWQSDTELNYDSGASSVNTQIAAAGTADEFGLYKDFVNAGSNTRTPSSTTTTGKSALMTLTLIVGAGQTAVIVNNYANNSSLPSTVNGKLIPGQAQAATPYLFENNTGVPQAISITVDQANSLYTRITGRVYAAYVTATDFPCIPLRSWDTARDLTVALKTIADLEAEYVTLQQHYKEVINGKTIERIAIGREVLKPDGKFYGLYRLPDKTGINYQRCEVASNGTVFNDSIGGYLDTTASNPPYALSTNAPLDYDKRYTLTGRNTDTSSASSLQINYFNGSNNKTLYLQPDLTWAETAPVNVLTAKQMLRMRTIALTFDMPSLALAGSGNFRLRIVLSGGSPVGHLPWTLCEGSSAIV